MQFETLKCEQINSNFVQPKLAFEKVIDLWINQCHLVNRRLSGCVSLASDSQEYSRVIDQLDAQHLDTHRSSLMKFIVKSDIFSHHAYEWSYWSDTSCVVFVPCILDDKRNPHISVAYRLYLVDDNSETRLQLDAALTDNFDIRWLCGVAFPRLLKWMNEVNINKTTIQSHRLLNIEIFTEEYKHIKQNWGRSIAAEFQAWTERTDPQKFVFEDCAIAAYLITLWKKSGKFPRQFCDVGCGNGLLVHLLQQQKVCGYGVDLRKRKIWTNFAEADLREQAINPESETLSDVDFIIGNHTDELTPWIPIMAARAKSHFFLLPCCPFSFYGRYQRLTSDDRDSNSIYTSYLKFIRNICQQLGYLVMEDRLKIPSTKRHCFVCYVPDVGLVSNVDKVIEKLLSPFVCNFQPKQKYEKVKNGSYLALDFRQKIVRRVFEHLLSISNTDINHEWRSGGVALLADVVALFDANEKKSLREISGGLQTVLKNHHQVFKVFEGKVCIRDWRLERQDSNAGERLRTKPCWFHANHPNGCPLSAQCCPFLHN